MPKTIERERTLRRREARSARKATPATPSNVFSAHVVLFGLLLVALTLALYSPVREHAFINYDDDVYVFKNSHVSAGLTWETVRWALTTKEQANWHPVTWLSHALDCQLFGLDPGYHHLTSLLIHGLNVLLLFLILQQMTGATLSSFFVAALFAWHPFNVESVAWIAERKNLVSTFFFLLTLGFYLWYVKKPELRRLAWVAGVFLLALASKPMVVTVPFLLLLLDYWPLQRIEGWTEPSKHFPAPQQPVRRLLIEKLPLLVLSALSCGVTFWVQKSGGAVRSLHRFPLWARFGNAFDSYLLYLWKTIWPAGFALHYPHPGSLLPLWKPALSAIVLSAISLAIWTQRKARPYLIVGWLWYLGTLLPVIGILQVGDQAMADRYAYLPLIGVFVMITWGAAELFERKRLGAAPRWLCAGAALVTLVFVSSRQLSYWQDNVSVWSHTLDVTKDNLEAERSIAIALDARGDKDAAIPHYLNVVRLDPDDPSTWVNIGAYYAAHNRVQEGIQDFQAAIKMSNDRDLSDQDRQYRSSAMVDLGFAYIILRDYTNAIESFEQANHSDPGMIDNIIENLNQSVQTDPSEIEYLKLSILQLAEGKQDAALSSLERANRENPSYAETRRLLGYLSSARK